MKRLARWVSKRWAPMATLFAIGAAVVASLVAFHRNRPATVLTLITTLVSLVIGIWSVEFLRREHELSSRPYVAITGNSVGLVGKNSVLVGLRLTNSGRTPGRMTGQSASSELSEQSTSYPPGSTSSNIIYPNEEVCISYEVTDGALLHYSIEYTNLAGTHSFTFAIAYRVTIQNNSPKAEIVLKRAD